MPKATLKYGLLFAFIGIVVKLLLWNLGYNYDNATISGATYLFLLLLTIIFSLKEKKKNNKEQSSFSEDFTYSMQSVGYFVLIISVFTFVYYSFIDVDFMQNKIDERIALATQMTEEDLSKISPLSKEEFLKSEQNIVQTIFSPKIHTTLTLVGFLIIGVIYALVLTILFRKAPDNQE
jgi:hypothetical protein